MEDLANEVFKLLGDRAGFSLAQVRFVRHREETISFRNGQQFNSGRQRAEGVGIRVRANNAWGFAATDNLTRDGVLKAAEAAWKVVRASAMVPREKRVDLVPEPVYKDRYSVRIDKDPLEMDFEEKAEVLLEANKRTMEGSPVIRMANTYYRARDQLVNFYSSDGNDIEQRILFTGAFVNGVAVAPPHTQQRTLQNFMTRGWEAVEMFDPIAKAEQVNKEATALVTTAEDCPKDFKGTLILEPYQLGLTIHESCGHPAELDRVLGYEADFAGTSWLTPEKLGKLQYGNSLVNITQDPSMPDVLGHFKYDDEGVLARPVPVIKEGIFVGYESDREHAAILGLERSSGNSRAENYNNVPIIRMNNLFLEAPKEGKDGSFKNIDEMIEDTKDGIYAINWKSHSIDDKRLNFQFNTQIGYRIENGEITKTLRDVTYQAITPEFWGATSGLTRETEIYGLPYCGKGSPVMQVGIVSHGGPWGRFENVHMGIKG